jgi:hypothetical protein
VKVESCLTFVSTIGLTVILGILGLEMLKTKAVGTGIKADSFGVYTGSIRIISDHNSTI